MVASGSVLRQARMGALSMIRSRAPIRWQRTARQTVSTKSVSKGGAPAACVDFFDAVLGPPNRFVPARLGLVATERERHIGCVLRQLDMARIHGNGGLAAGAGVCHCSELVGAQPLATIVTSGSCIPLLRGKPRVQPSGSLISAISSCQSFSFLAAVQGLEAGLQRTRREATPRTVFRSLTAPPARGYCCCDIAITPTTRL